MADLRGARGTRPTPPPPKLKFFQFHAVFGKIWQNHMSAPPPPPSGVGNPSSGKSWIRHCFLRDYMEMADYSDYKMFLQDLLSSYEIKTYVEELETLNKSNKSVRARQASLDFDVSNKETICPICSFTKPVIYWIKGRNPKDTHKRESPRCEFVLKCEGRWHFLARNQRQAVAHGNRTVARPGRQAPSNTTRGHNHYRRYNRP